VLTEPLPCNGLFRLVTETCVSEPLDSNGLFRLSGVMSHHYQDGRSKEDEMREPRSMHRGGEKFVHNSDHRT
jgi:hypothetical protein